GGALRVRPAAESEWLTCGAGSRVSACGKYADLCRQRTAITTTTRTVARRKAIIANTGGAADCSKVVRANTLVVTGTGVFSTIGGYHPGVTDTDIINNRPEEPTVDTQCKKPQEGKLHKNPKDPEPPRGDAVAMGDAGPAQVTDSPKTVVPEEKVPVAGPAPDSEPTSVKDSVMKSEGDQNLVTHTEVGEHLPPQQEHPPSDDRRDPTTANNHTTKEKSSNSTDGENQNLPSTTGSLPNGTEAAGSTSSSGSADAQITNQGLTETQTTSSPTTGTQSSENDDSNNSNTQEHSERNTEGSGETNSTAPPSTESTGEAPTPTSSPVPVPDSQISNTIASNVQKNANADSSVSPVWMRTAAPLLIVAVLFSVTVY
ncbi:uncharacterized protein TM35_000811040, partial [Trypanosoma theileri]